VNNDSLAELLIAAQLLVVLVAVRRFGRHPAKPAAQSGENQVWLLLGLLLALGLVTKVTTYIMAPVAALGIFLAYRGRPRRMATAAALVFGVALAVGLAWWVRNIFVYGGLDPLGTVAHNGIVTGQPRTSDWVQELGWLQTLRAFGQTTFQSFWGQFGWMGVPMPRWVYGPLAIFTVLTAVGCLAAARSLARRPRPGVRSASAILLATLLLAVLLYLSYNVTFVQHQGRYLFPALAPIAVGVAVAWRTLLAPLAGRWPGVYGLFALALGAGLFALDMIALFRFIVPALS
jgi:4-amino-4-deoxy-L-arabinose transferase-like glycosyltransferase